MKLKVSNAMLNVLLGALASGILFMDNFPQTPKILVGTCAGVIVFALLLTWRRKNLTAWLVAPTIFFAIGALRFWTVDNLPADDVSKLAGRDVKLTGIVREEPQTRTLPNGMTQVRFVVDAQAVKVKGELQ